jgi:hypothetical protein
VRPAVEEPQIDAEQQQHESREADPEPERFLHERDDTEVRVERLEVEPFTDFRSSV